MRMLLSTAMTLTTDPDGNFSGFKVIASNSWKLPLTLICTFPFPVLFSGIVR